MATRSGRPCLAGLLGLLFLQLSTALGLAAQRVDACQSVPGHVLVRFSPGALDEALLATLSDGGAARIVSLPGLGIALLVSDPEHASALRDRLSRSPQVLWAEPNYLCRVALTAPNDPAYDQLVGDLYLQWPARSLDALAAWTRYPGRYFDALSRPQETPLVALIDTGVDPAHPDFMNPGAASAEVSEGGQLMLSSARAFLSQDPGASPWDVTDQHGHGTHLAGLIAAGTDNGPTAGSGIAGLGYPVRLLPLKVAGPAGVATHADIAAAIVYAADQGARIILIAFTGAIWSHTLQRAVDYAWDQGCFLIGPAGDAGAGYPSFPAGCPHVFGVAALTASGTVWDYSSPGYHVALAAPGGDFTTGVYSTLPTYACTLRSDLTTPAYGWFFGTSQAAAHVAAAAGLHVGSQGVPPATVHAGTDIWQALQRTASPAAGWNEREWNPDCGYGALQLTALVDGGSSEESGLGSIVGRVLIRGSPAVDASVTAIPEDSGSAVTVRTLFPAGAYRIPNLPPGLYSITASAEGASTTLEQVAVLPGCDSPGIDFSLGDPPADAALIAAQIPAAAVRRATADLSLAFSNTGESTWDSANGYCLQQVDCKSPFFNSLPRICLAPDEAVAPGETHIFSFSLAVPDLYGFCDIAWRMSQLGGQGDFGDIARATISVTSFLDVPADHWAVAEIEACKEAGVVKGYGDAQYGPEGTVSRDQMAVYLARALVGGDDAVPPGPDEPSFLDVDREHWAYHHIEYVRSREIAEGFPDGYYRPEWPLDRGQMAVFVARALAGGESAIAGYLPPPTAPSFPDVSPQAWNYKHVEYVREAEVVFGYLDGYYHPEYPCTRDQMAVYVARAFKL